MALLVYGASTILVEFSFFTSKKHETNRWTVEEPWIYAIPSIPKMKIFNKRRPAFVTKARFRMRVPIYRTNYIGKTINSSDEDEFLIDIAHKVD